MTPQFTPRARDDLKEILTYIEKESPVSADRVRVAMSRTITLIAGRPGIGVQNARNPALQSFLVLGYPYRIHYLVESATIWIVHIRHSSRHPWNAEPAQ